MTLSDDAVPQLTALLDTQDPQVAQQVKKGLADWKESLDAERSWQSFNLSSLHARQVLQSYDLGSGDTSAGSSQDHD